MMVDSIKDKGVKFLSKILGYTFNHGSRINSILAIFLHSTYVMGVEGRKFNLYHTAIV
jgi:hypothetical protein